MKMKTGLIARRQPPGPSAQAARHGSIWRLLIGMALAMTACGVLIRLYLSPAATSVEHAVTAVPRADALIQAFHPAVVVALPRPIGVQPVRNTELVFDLPCQLQRQTETLMQEARDPDSEAGPRCLKLSEERIKSIQDRVALLE